MSVQAAARTSVSSIAPVATWLVFPALLAGVVLATQHLLTAGLPPPGVSAVILLATVATLLLLERVFPLHRAWNARPERLDLLLLLGNRLIDIAVIAGTLSVLGRLGSVGISVRLWPGQLPLGVQALLGITLAESLRYLLHRLSHRPGWLGRVHRTHHQPRRMYTLNGPRLHPANQAWLALANVVPMLMLGAGLPAVTLAANVTVFFVLLQHANLRLRFDVWNQLLATPDVHRLHHQRQHAQVGVNYGIVLLLFDRLLGTYQPVREACGADDIGGG